MTTIRRSLAYSAAESYFSLALQIVSTMVISRILTPEETGVFAVATVFAALASNFRDFGVGEYLIQENDLTAEKIRAALTVNIAISWTVGVILFFAAPYAANFYRSVGVGEVMRVQAFNFLLIPFGAVTMAYFRRELDFKPIFIVSVVANLTSFAVSIVCALRGMGYMSLAWSSLAGVALTVLMSVWFRPTTFPRWPGLRGVADVFHFGKFASGIYFMGQLGKGAPEMIIGRAQDMPSVAIFSRAAGLVEIFNRLVLRTVMPVCLPYFAKSSREDGSLLRGYLTSISYLTVIGWPFVAFLGFIAYSAIRIVYGVQWVSATPLAQIVCAAAAVDLVYHLAKEALLAEGRVRTSNRLQAGMVLAQIAGLMAVVPFGLIGAAWGVLAATVVGAALSHHHLHQAIGLRLSDVARTCLPSLYVSVLSVAPVAAWVMVEGITEDNFARFAFVGGAITALGWILSVKLIGHPLWPEVLKAGNLAGATVTRLVRR